MGESVRAEELVVMSEALTQIGAEAVIDRASIGVVRVHVAERDAVLVGRRIAIRVEALAGETAFDGLCEGHASASGRTDRSCSDGWVHPSRAEDLPSWTTPSGTGRAGHT